MRSFNGGRSWETIPLRYFIHLGESPQVRHRVLAGKFEGNNLVMISSDDDTTWSTVDTVMRHPVSDFQLLGIGDTLFFGTSQQNDSLRQYSGVFRSFDDGKSWSPSLLGRSIVGLSQDERRHERVYAATRDTIFRSRDAGATWEPIFSQPFIHIVGIAKHWYEDTLYIATSDTGICALAEPLTGVHPEETAENAILDQNFPNPLRASEQATIRYRIARRTDVDLSVYDLLGRHVAMLAHGVQDAGTYTASFNSGDLPAGFYSYRLLASGVVRTRRMLLTR